MKLTHAARWLAFGFLLLSISAVLAVPASAQIGVGISVRIGPPALPVYEQPLCPGPGYLWTPGYWAWDDDDGYYWVPGTWVEAPVGQLWTPGYWGWNDGAYIWNAGYWGPEIGFYGGINYGYGYGGNGFYGGEWRSGRFFYNTAVTRVNTTTITNVYVNRTVIVNNSSHVAFNGGTGGVRARPTARQETYARESHTPPIAAQTQQREAASKNRALFASTNHGRPAIAASARPGEFSGKGVVAARAAGGTYRAPKMSPKEARASGPGASGARENRAEAPKGEAARPAARPAEKSAESRAEKPAAHPAEPRNNAMKANRPENENRTEKPAASHTASKPAENKPASRPESRPEAKPKTESHANRPPVENSRPASEPRPENKPKPEPRPSAPRESPARESAPKASAPKPSAPRESAPKPEHSAAPAHSAPAPKAAPAPKPAPARPASEPKEHK
jgi:hypothetical protein